MIGNKAKETCNKEGWQIDRNNLFQYRTDKSKTDRILLVLTYSKGLPHIREIIKKKMTVLHKSEKMKKSVHKTTNFSIQTRYKFKR
jgi:hypothetical protein